MLEELLRIVAEGGAHSYEDLAERLAISEPLLEALLENLARLGYLRALADGCGAQCTACPISGCAAGAGRVWALTEKGGQAAARLSA